MDKQQIIEYLNAVCDAESIVQACNDAIVMYEEKRKQVFIMAQPQKPERPSVRYTEEPFKIGDNMPFVLVITVVVAFVVGFIVSEILPIDTTAMTSLWVLVASFLIAFFIVFLLHDHGQSKKHGKAAEEANQEYEAAKVRYENRISAYGKNCIISENIMNKLDAAIRVQQEHRDNAQKKLDELYARNVLYPTFRNLVAAYQIREYLQMGICETLDGANGAYAQYMQDVRTQRVCESIADLKKAVVSAIYALQSTLVGELRQINGNLSSLNGTMEDSFNKLNSNMRSMQQATAEQIGGYFTAANRHLETIDQNIANAAHNTYIQQRFKNVETYLLRAPVDPS